MSKYICRFLALSLSISISLSFAASFTSGAFGKSRFCSENQPVPDFVQTPAAPDGILRGIKLGGKADLVKHGEGIYQLEQGIALIQTSGFARVNAASASIYARPNTAFVVDTHSKTTSILNLSDRQNHSLTAILHRHQINLNPGEEVIIKEEQLSDLKFLTPSASIGYRRPHLLTVDGNQVLLFEFSIGDALSSCSIFSKLKDSPDQKDKKLLAEIMKTAAALNVMFAKSREKYTGNQKQHHLAPPENKKLATSHYP